MTHSCFVDWCWRVLGGGALGVRRRVLYAGCPEGRRGSISAGAFGNEDTTRPFASRTELLDGNGAHIRFLPGAHAASMVERGAAEIANENGRVKSIRLLESARTHLMRIGGPGDGRASGVRFSVREKLDGGGIAWKHHARCRDYE